MPRQVKPLTPSAVANAKPKAEPYMLPDGGGMFLLVNPDGSRWWRFRYVRPGTGKRNMLSLGTFPDVPLKRAREKRDDARKLVADGIDPGDKRQAEAVAAADTFEAVAREWYAKQSGQWVPAHGERIIRRLERDGFPWIGRKPVAKLDARAVLATLRRIESRGAIETAHRALQNIGQVFRYAVATARASSDVTRDLRGALSPITERHHAAIIDPDQVGDLLRAIDAYSGTLPVRCALRLAPLVFLRPGELRMAEWAEFDLDAAEWNIPAHRRKLKKALKDDPATPPHCVPLAPQAVAILRELQPLTGAGRFVFPGARDRKRPLSDMALLGALRRMGYDKDTMTAHGFRAMARTILDERLGFRPDVIEHQLAHAVKDPNGRAYNRTAHLPERRKMMQAWADYLDTLRDETRKVVPIKRETHA
jgi:integrase